MTVKVIMMARVMMATGLIIMYDQSREGYDGQGKIMLNIRMVTTIRVNNIIMTAMIVKVRAIITK